MSMYVYFETHWNDIGSRRSICCEVWTWICLHHLCKPKHSAEILDEKKGPCNDEGLLKKGSHQETTVTTAKARWNEKRPMSPIYKPTEPTAIPLLLTQLEKAFFRGKLVLTYAKHVWCNSVETWKHQSPRVKKECHKNNTPPCCLTLDFSGLDGTSPATSQGIRWFLPVHQIKVGGWQQKMFCTGWSGCWLGKTWKNGCQSSTALLTLASTSGNWNCNHWWKNETSASTATESKHEARVAGPWTFTI